MTNEHKRSIIRSAQFRKDVRIANKQGNWKGHRECHVTPDWLLVYRKSDAGDLLLILARSASHGELGF